MLSISSEPSSPDTDQGNSPMKRSFSTSMNETEFLDESKNIVYEICSCNYETKICRLICYLIS